MLAKSPTCSQQELVIKPKTTIEELVIHLGSVFPLVLKVCKFVNIVGGWLDPDRSAAWR